MEKIKYNDITILEAMESIQYEGYKMPAFQRQYVWSMEQIEKLWDSILLGYPMSTFLFWKVDKNNVEEDTYFCDFLRQCSFDCRKQAESTNYELFPLDFKNTDIAVLDGQQRLTSLYLSLFGSIEIRPKNAKRNSNNSLQSKLYIELDRNKFSLDEDEFNSKRFNIKFSDKFGQVSPTQFEIKEILKFKGKDIQRREEMIENYIKHVSFDSKDYARNILLNLHKKVFEEKLIRYTEINNMNQDDALEMFVRFNSGGKQLKKSDITMSILEAYWPSAKTEFGKILIDEYKGFGTDFIIRSALMLFGDVVKSNINRYIADTLKNRWGEFVSSLKFITKMLREENIDVSRFAGSWNTILPILYYVFYNERKNIDLNAVKSYLYRAVLFTFFQSGTTSKLQQMKSAISQYDNKITLDLLDNIKELKVTESKIEDLLNLEKGERITGELFYFLSKEWLKDIKYEQDHLHPYSAFENFAPNGISVTEWSEWKKMANRVANIHLLEGRSNCSKNNMRLMDYYMDMNDFQKNEFHLNSIIPRNTSMEIKEFKEFYEKRKELIIEKIKKLFD